MTESASPRIDMSPFVVLGAPRSGTSLVTGLLALHGVWTGTCKGGDWRNPKGYYESQPIKQLLLTHAGRLIHEAREAEPLDKGRWQELVGRAIIEDGYQGGSWAAKHGAVYAPLWESDFEPIFINVWRNPDAVLKSGQHAGMLKNKAGLYACRQAMTRIQQRHPDTTVDVDTDVLVGQGNFEAIEDALRRRGIAPNRNAMAEFVEPRYWRYGGTA